jgi:hypothetical protein
MISANVDAGKAQRRLEETDGFVRPAIEGDSWFVSLISASACSTNVRAFSSRSSAASNRSRATSSPGVNPI